VGYESYIGSLRGARGTLWSEAGNSLDEASLGIALLRGSGIPARYAQGTLSDAQARQLILSMFPASFQAVGALPAGAVLSDPANDPKLLAETRPHFWVQFDAGAGFRDLDGSLAAAQLGQALTPAAGTFNEVPDALRHKTTVRLKRELTTPAAGLFTGGLGAQDVATVLEATFSTAELVGRPLSIGHIVTQTSLGAVFSATTTRYAPYLAVGDVAIGPATTG